VADLPAVELQPFTQEDIPRLCGWLTSERDLLAWGGPYYRYPLTAGAIETVLNSAAVTAGTHQPFRVWAPDLGEVIGHAEFLMLSLDHRHVRLGRLLIGPRDLRGRGYGQALVRALLRRAFHDLGLHRVELEVYDFNHPAIRCYQACGFELEGRRRDAVRLGDDYWTSVLMAQLEPRRQPDWRDPEGAAERTHGALEVR
jgi:RimJ/RimL family protein N-acetyltransferase